MTIAYHIDPALGVTFSKWEGLITADDFLAHAQRILADPAWPPRKGHHLTDLRFGRLDDSLDEAALQNMARMYGNHPQINSVKMAIVASEEFSKAAIFEHTLLQYRPSVIVFNSLDTACAWLGIETGVAENIFAKLKAEPAPAASV